MALHDGGHRITEALAVLGPRTSQNLARVRCIDVTNSIDGNNCADNDFGARHLVTGCAEPALHGVVHAEHFADGSACTSTDVAFSRSFSLGGLACQITGFLIGTHRKISDTEIHQDCCWYNRNDAFADLEAEIVLFKITHNASRSRQTIGTAAGKQNSLNLLHIIDRIEQIGFTRTGRRTAYINTRGSAFFAEKNSAAGRAFCQCVVSQLDSGYIRDASTHKLQHACSSLSSCRCRIDDKGHCPKSRKRLGECSAIHEQFSPPFSLY